MDSDNEINYTYDANGNKLTKILISSDGNAGKVTNYIGNYIYADGDLKTMITTDGHLWFSQKTLLAGANII